MYIEQRIDAVEAATVSQGTTIAMIMADLAMLQRRVAAIEPPPAPAPVSGYRLVWADEFDGTALDTAKWVNGSNSWGGTTYANVGWRPENVALNGGLRLTVRREATGGKEFSGAILHTNGRFTVPTSGRLEVCCKYAAVPGLWPALWLLHDEPNRGAGIVEVDLLEVMTHKPDEVYHNFHWYDAPGDAGHRQKNRWMRQPAGFSNGYHTYAVEWSPEGFVYFIDGVETWRHEAPIPVGPMHVLITWKVGGWGGNWPVPAFQSAEFLVDYVRVYERV